MPSSSGGAGGKKHGRNAKKCQLYRAKHKGGVGKRRHRAARKFSQLCFKSRIKEHEMRTQTGRCEPFTDAGLNLGRGKVTEPRLVRLGRAVLVVGFVGRKWW